MTDFLNWLTSPDGGALVLILWGVSWALEEVEGWHKLPSKTRSLIILGLAVLVAILAATLQQFPEAVEAIDPWFKPVSYVVLAWVATQTAHKVDYPRKNNVG